MAGSAFHPLGDTMEFSSNAELAQAVLAIDFSMGAERQTSGFRERHALVGYLLTLASQNCLPFPVSISKRVTPDYLWRRGTTEIGVEVTEGTSQEYRRGPARHRPSSPDQPLSDSDFSSTRYFRGGWAGRNSEKEWVDLMINAALTKARGYGSRGRPYEAMELLIYAITPGGGFESDGFSDLKNDLLIALETQDPSNDIGAVFSDVHVISGSSLVMSAMRNPKLLEPPGETQWSLKDGDVLARQLRGAGLLPR